MGRAGSAGNGGSEFFVAGSGEDAFTEGGLAVNPLLLANFSSVILPLPSFFPGLLLQISDFGDEAFAEEPVLDVESVWRCVDSCGISGSGCPPSSRGGGGRLRPGFIASNDSFLVKVW
jgi:hypothetical protein